VQGTIEIIRVAAGGRNVPEAADREHRLGEQWNLPPETITLTEIKARTNGNAADVRRVFEMADQVAYSGQDLPSTDLAYWQAVVTKELERLK